MADLKKDVGAAKAAPEAAPEAEARPKAIPCVAIRDFYDEKGRHVRRGERYVVRDEAAIHQCLRRETAPTASKA